MNTQYNFDESAGRCLSAFLIINSVNFFIKSLFPLWSINRYLSLVLGLCFIIFYLFQMRKFDGILAKTIAFEFILLAFIAISCFINYRVRNDIISRCVWTVGICVPLYVIARNIGSVEDFFYQLKIGIWCSTLCTLVYTILSGIVHASNEYNMSLGYIALVPAVFSTLNFKHNKVYYIMFIVNLLVILLAGSRGSLLCFSLFVILTVLIQPVASLKDMLLRFVLCVSLIMVVLFWNDIILLIVSLMERFNLTSRSIGMALNGNIENLTGRGDIWKSTSTRIMEKPIMGWGIAGDLAFDRSYPHQIFLEILVHFGFAIGLPICFYIVCTIIHGIRKKNLIIIGFICCGFVPLFLSSTYLNSPLFWVTMGICNADKIQKINFVIAQNRR